MLADPKLRERYDTSWSFWPWEHPAAYWLRSNGEAIICTRCGKASDPRPLDVDLTEHAEAFVRTHLRCTLGFGLRGPVPEADPLLAQV